MPPGQAGTGNLRMHFFNISYINIQAVAVSQQRDPGTERQDLSPTDPRLASGFARRRGVEIAADPVDRAHAAGARPAAAVGGGAASRVWSAKRRKRANRRCRWRAYHARRAWSHVRRAR